MIRLCKNCKNMADKTGTLERVLGLCRKFMWLCPFGKEQCGAVNGEKQYKLRKEYFLQMLADVLAEKDPNKIC